MFPWDQHMVGIDSRSRLRKTIQGIKLQVLTCMSWPSMHLHNHAVLQHACFATHVIVRPISEVF